MDKNFKSRLQERIKSYKWGESGEKRPKAYKTETDMARIASRRENKMKREKRVFLQRKNRIGGIKGKRTARVTETMASMTMLMTEDGTAT